MKPALFALFLVSFLAGPSSASDQFPLETSPLLNPPVLELAQIGGRPRDEQPKDTEKEKPGIEVINPRKAMLYSLLLPGLGQQMAGRAERARVFYAVEAGIWATFVTFRLQGDARTDRYIEFAEFAGGVDPSGKDSDYWRTIAQFERSDPGPFSANEFIRRQARAIYPDDIEAQHRYLENNGYFNDRAWDWQNADNLARYQKLRSRSIDAYDRADLSIAAAIAHRLVSMIDAARMASKANREASEKAASEEDRFNPRFGMKLVRDGHDRVPMLTFKTSF